MTLGNPGRKLGRAHPKVPELLTQKEQMLIRNAIYISFACCFEYNLHAAPLKSKGTDLAWACLFHLCPSTLFCSLSGETFTCWAHIYLDSPGPGTKILGNPFMVRCKKKKEEEEENQQTPCILPISCGPDSGLWCPTCLNFNSASAAPQTA